MIPVFAPAFAPKPTALIDIIKDLGLATNLQVCLDAGDSASYDGASQIWVDRSGNGLNFNRGTTSSSETSDPTFNGTAGRQSINEYFSFDGGDVLTLGQTNPASINQMHQDSAKFTFIEIEFSAFGAGDDGATGNGMNIGEDVNNHPGFEVFTTSATVYQSAPSSLTIPPGVWNFSGISFDEAAGALTFAVNGSYDAKAGQTYSSPSAAAATYPFQIAGIGDGVTTIAPAGGRVGWVAIWSRALSQAEMTLLFNATRGRYGL